jgi:beta-glucanase (GH16 family)
MQSKKNYLKKLSKVLSGFSKMLMMVTALLLSFHYQSNAQCRQLIWSDEFNGTGAPDPANWTFEVNGNGGGNGEEQYYTDRRDNSIVGGGTLKLIAKKETYLGKAYTSARMITKGKFDFKYGRVDVRAKFPTGVGTWPAIWMLGSNIDAVSWPNCGEIDIAEHLGRTPNTIYGTLHYPGRSGGQSDGRSIVIPTATTDFHIYSVEWSSTSVRIYVDNILYHTIPNNNKVPFNHNFFLLLNMAMGGNFGGAVDPNFTQATMEVDYIKVYKDANNFGISGSTKSYFNEINKSYSIPSVAGATYNWTVPAGATITAGQGTNSITVNWGTTSGNVAVTTTLPSCTEGNPVNTYQFAVTAEPLIPIEKTLEDFEANRTVTYLAKTTGTLTQAVANPAASGVNISTLVGKYDRKATSLYDVLYMSNITVTNANDFVIGKKRMSIDIYTNAPVGSKITMQLENGAKVSVTPPSNGTTGRHSAYAAYTIIQNKWQRLEFEYERSLDAGLSIYDVDNVVFLFEPASNSGNTYYFDNLLIRAKPTPPVVLTNVLENYDGTSKITKGISTGVYTANVVNPGVNAVNGSANVARYVRKNTEQYDVLFFGTGLNIVDAGKFKSQSSRIVVDIYSTAPVGTLIDINFERTPTASGPYPNGRNSAYRAKTTKQNQWETLVFDYNASPDAGTSNVSINQLAFLFNGNSLTGDTYYIDNIRITESETPATFTNDVIYEDYQLIHNISFSSASGTYTPNAANPSASGINTSTQVGQYVRNATQSYDLISFVTSITNGGEFKAGTKAFAMDVYTTAPVGTPITWQLEGSSISTSINYPTGRHSTYVGIVKQTNTWHTIVFSSAGTPDASMKDNEVNRFVMLFDPNSNSAGTYYFDNLRSLNVNSSVVNPTTLPAPWVSSDIGTVAPAGSATFATGAFTLKGSGADIWGTADGFQYVYQPWTTDGEIIARIPSLTNTNPNAKAGLMFRETLTAGSKHAFIEFSPNNTIELLSRNVTGGTTAASILPNLVLPQWIKLVKVGNVFTGFYSANGTTWIQVGGAVTIPMSSSVFVGMAVNSHNVGTLATGVFDNVSVNTLASNPNLALNKPITASSIENVNLAANFANDGNQTTRWATVYANAQDWIYVDLGANYNINRVKLNWEGAYAKQYQIQVSTDPNNWTGKTVYTTPTIGSDGAIDDVTLTGLGRYVRILCTQKALAPYGYSLFELEVYGTFSSARIASESSVNNESEASMTVYPNPSNDFIKVLMPGEAESKQITISDLTGKSVIFQNLDATKEEHTIDIRNLNHGMYLIMLKSDEKIQVKKIIKL